LVDAYYNNPEDYFQHGKNIASEDSTEIVDSGKITQKEQQPETKNDFDEKDGVSDDYLQNNEITIESEEKHTNSTEATTNNSENKINYSLDQITIKLCLKLVLGIQTIIDLHLM
jgi:hypothetical protein